MPSPLLGGIILKTIKIVHECNHIESTVSREQIIEEITKTKDSSSRLSHATNYVISVFKRDALARTGIKFLTENGSWRFNKNTNSIEWGINPGFEVPTIGESIEVEYVKEVASHRQMKAWDCEKCNGNGWYVDYLGTSGQVEETSGSSKLTQDFIKEVLTVRQEDGYGTFMSDIVGSNVYDDGDEIKNKIETMLYQVKESMISRQNSFIQNGVNLPNSEKVSDVIVQSIEPFDSYTKLVLTVLIRDMDDKITQNALLIE